MDNRTAHEHDTNPKGSRRWKKMALWGCGCFILLIVALLVIIFIGFTLHAPAPEISPSATESAFTPAPQAGEDRASGAAASSAYLLDAEDPSVGPADATTTVVEFGDFQCPFCQQAFPIIRELMIRYGGRVRFVFRDFPVSQIHAYAEKAAEAGECAHAQEKFWEMHDKMFQNQDRIDVPDLKRYARAVGLDGERFDTCLDAGVYADEVAKDAADGVALGVRGTPTWFINGRKVEGVIPRDTFIELLEQLLASLSNPS